jgi:hypothetical protein
MAEKVPESSCPYIPKEVPVRLVLISVFHISGESQDDDENGGLIGKANNDSEYDRRSNYASQQLFRIHH